LSPENRRLLLQKGGFEHPQEESVVKKTLLTKKRKMKGLKRQSWSFFKSSESSLGLDVTEYTGEKVKDPLTAHTVQQWRQERDDLITHIAQLTQQLREVSARIKKAEKPHLEETERLGIQLKH